MKNKDKLSKPTSAGRVAGKGLSTKWSSYYNTGGRKEKKTSLESPAREVQELRAQVARILEIVQEQVQQQLGATITAIVPTLIQEISAWIGGGPCWPPAIHALNPEIKVGTRAVIVAPSRCYTCSWTISGIRATCALSS